MSNIYLISRRTDAAVVLGKERQWIEHEMPKDAVLVLWTKDPQCILDNLDVLRDKKFLVHVTITGYGHDIEPHVPMGAIDAFKEISGIIGANRMVWRYDPILFTSNYTLLWHKMNFKYLSSKLDGFTDTCILSMVDRYGKVAQKMPTLHFWDGTYNPLLQEMFDSFQIESDIADISLQSCAENGLQQFGIPVGACIDPFQIERVFPGTKVSHTKDKGQRTTCNCVQSIDLGQYRTCPHGCKYCYAS